MDHYITLLFKDYEIYFKLKDSLNIKEIVHTMENHKILQIVNYQTKKKSFDFILHEFYITSKRIHNSAGNESVRFRYLAFHNLPSFI